MNASDSGPVDGPRAITAALLMVASTAMLPSVAAIHDPHTHAHDGCDLSKETEQIFVANPGHGNATVTELLWVATRDHSTWDDIHSTSDTHVWLDAFVDNLGCHSASLTYDLTLNDGLASTATAQLRFYDHFADELGETSCVSGSGNGSVPDGTQYVAVIPCEGIPDRVSQNTMIPHTVEVELELSS